MTNKQRCVMAIATVNGESGILQKASRMTEQECNKYLKKTWGSFSEKQKQLVNHDNPLGWSAIIRISDEECDQRIKMKEEDKSFAMNLLLNP